MQRARTAPRKNGLSPKAAAADAAVGRQGHSRTGQGSDHSRTAANASKRRPFSHQRLSGLNTTERQAIQAYKGGCSLDEPSVESLGSGQPLDEARQRNNDVHHDSDVLF